MKLKFVLFINPAPDYEDARACIPGNLPCTEVLAAGPLAGEMGPDPDRDCCDWVEPAGDPTGEGDGPLLWLERWGEAWGEKGDCPWLPAPPCSPWLLLLLLLEDPPALTAEPSPASVPVGRSSIEPDRSWNRGGSGVEGVVMLTEETWSRRQLLTWAQTNLKAKFSRQIWCHDTLVLLQLFQPSWNRLWG